MLVEDPCRCNWMDVTVEWRVKFVVEDLKCKLL